MTTRKRLAALALLIASGAIAQPDAVIPAVEGIHASYCSESGTSVAVTWLSVSSNAGSVAFAAASNALVTRVQEGAGPVARGDRFIHRVELRDLAPGTRYYYQCGLGAGAATGPVCSFKTAPPEQQPVTFAVLGDIQVKGRNPAWHRTALWLANKRPDFCLSLGDQVDSGLRLDQWLGLLVDGAPLFESTVFMPLIGNHEVYDGSSKNQRYPSLYLDLFCLPDNGSLEFQGQWYAFRAGCVRIAMLAAYPWRADQACDVRTLPEQGEWLDRTLGKGGSGGWALAALHPPAYSTGPHGGGTRWFQSLWGEVVERHHVAAVFSGHTHAFEITHPLRGGRRVDAGQGIVYYNAAGVAYSALATGNALTEARASREREPLVLIVTASPGRLVFSTWNTVADTVAYETVMP